MKKEDYLFILRGKLMKRKEHDGLGGVSSNPSPCSFPRGIDSQMELRKLTRLRAQSHHHQHPFANV